MDLGGRALRARGLGFLVGAIALVAVSSMLAPRLVANLSQTRTISLYNIHNKETLTVEYKRNGKYIQNAMDQIDWMLRDWRRNEKTKMDPELIDLLWEVHTELGSREPIHIISAYRSRNTNNMLRSSRGGQASQSRHIVGKAADVHFPDVPVRRIRYSALIRERGGVGYYPTSAIPFVHLDTDRVRAWPRLPRQELALLFPDGRTKHVPADGRALAPGDAQAARAQNRELAVEVAQVHQLRLNAMNPNATRVATASSPRPGTAAQPQQRVAAATPTANTPRQSAWPAAETKRTPAPPAPKLVAEPKMVDRPTRLAASRTTDSDRKQMAQLAALASMSSFPGSSRAPVATPVALERKIPAETLESLNSPAPSAGQQRMAALDPQSTGEQPSAQGRFGWGSGWSGPTPTPAVETTWAVAPEYDEEHPEELSYRPFPIAPYMTETASPDDPALARMEHPDVAKTLELLDQAGELPPMRLRPGQQVARVLWAQEFTGEAVPLASVFEQRPQGPSGLAERTVQLSSR